MGVLGWLQVSSNPHTGDQLVHDPTRAVCGLASLTGMGCVELLCGGGAYITS